MRRVRSLLLAFVLIAAFAGCGDDSEVFGDDVDTTAVAATTATTVTPTTSEAPPPPPSTSATTLPATTVPPPTTAATTTTAAPTTTTTAAPTTTAGTTYVVNELDFFPDPLPGSDQAHGSGCVVPGGSTTLTDGIWFGFVEGYTPGMLTFDLACFYTGAVAEAKATEDGEEAYDFYIRNNNPGTRQVPVATGARVWYVDMTSGNVQVPDEIPLASWPHPDSFMVCPSTWCSVWLYVNGGEVTAIVEQYLP